jgi:hypothetical protein
MYNFYILDVSHVIEYIYNIYKVSVSPGSVKVKVTLRLTVGQSVSRGVEPQMGLMIRYLLLFDSYGLVFVGRPL